MPRHVAALHRVQAVLAPAAHVARRVLLRLDHHVVAVEGAQARVEAHEEGHEDRDGGCREAVGEFCLRPDDDQDAVEERVGRGAEVA